MCLIPLRLVLQQILSCSISVFWGLQLECLIDKFNDFDKLMNAFFPFFHRIAQSNLHELKRMGASSASVKRASFVDGARSAELTQYISANKIKVERKTGPHHFPLLDAGVKYIVEMYLRGENGFFETELMAHFSTLLSTEDNPVDVNRNNISTLVTERRRYKEVPLPLVDLKGNLKDDEPLDELEEGEVDVMGNVIVTTPTKKPKTTQKKGEASSSAKRNKKRNVALATTDVPDLEQKSEGSAVPIKKHKSSTDDSCEFCGKVVKLVAPAKIALPNPQYEQLLNCSFLPPTDSPSGTRLFDSFFKFCSADKKNVVLISRPFRSTTLKESGVPVVVRQVSFCFLLHESSLGPNALIVHFFSLGISNARDSAPMSFQLYGWLARSRIQFLWLAMSFIPFLNLLLVTPAL